MRFAVSRTPSAIGRISRLIVSIIMRMGISSRGVPSGNMWARERFGWLRNPIRTVPNHKGNARPKLTDN